VSHTDRALRVFGASVALYEAAAIISGRLPTISKLCRQARRTPAGRVAVAALCLWLSVHLMHQEIEWPGAQTSCPR
jgi:hypothetical protein